MTHASGSDSIHEVLARLAAPAEVRRFLREILSPRELRDLDLRWEIVRLLAAGMPQRAIATKLGVSLCKITRGARILKTPHSLVAEKLK